MARSKITSDSIDTSIATSTDVDTVDSQLDTLSSNITTSTRALNNQRTNGTAASQTAYTSYYDWGELVDMRGRSQYEKRILMLHTTYQHIITTTEINNSLQHCYFKIKTPQGYADDWAGGSAEFTVTWHTDHAAGSAMKYMKMVFGNNHGNAFAWDRSGLTTHKVGDSYYGWTPYLDLYRDSANTTTTMQYLYMKVSGYPGGYNRARITLDWKGWSSSGHASDTYLPKSTNGLYTIETLGYNPSLPSLSVLLNG